jgi:hypothetical protein
MISIEEARKELNMPDLTDQEVTRIRNNLYALISRILDDLYEEKPKH